MEPDWQKCKGKDPEREREIRLEDDKEKEHEGKIQEVKEKWCGNKMKRKSNNAGIDVRKR